MSKIEMLELELENLELNLAYLVHNNGSVIEVNRVINAIRWHVNALEVAGQPFASLRNVV